MPICLIFTLLLTEHDILARRPLILDPKSSQQQDLTDRDTITRTPYRGSTLRTPDIVTTQLILQNNRRRSPKPSAVSSREAQER